MTLHVNRQTALSQLLHMVLSGLATILCLLVMSDAARAAKLNVGPETNIRHIQDVRLQNGIGEPLFLGYKVTFHWFGLPYMVSKEGHVLGVKGKPVHYAIEPSQLEGWQAHGHVPARLPAYRLGFADIVLGHLLWLVGGLIALFYAGRAVRSRRKKPAAKAVETAAAQAPATAPPLPQTAPAKAEQATAKPETAQTPMAEPKAPLPARTVVAALASQASAAVNSPRWTTEVKAEHSKAAPASPQKPVAAAEARLPTDTVVPQLNDQAPPQPQIAEPKASVPPPAPSPSPSSSPPSSPPPSPSQALATPGKATAKVVVRVKALKAA